METLNSTKYPNNSRIVSGNVTLFDDDSVLLCNTSSGAVTINLNLIPANYWNTTYKLYIVDNNNNASVNNITIVAGAGQTINGASTLVLNTNGVSCMVRINSNTAYISNIAITSTSPTFDIIDITYAAFNALVLANTIQKGWFYRITDAGLTDEGVIVQGTTINTNSIQGSGIFLNADYQNVGNYSGVSGFVANLGLWSTVVQAVVIGNVVIWNNLHWKNLTGAWGTFPNADAVNWVLLSKTTTNGYIKEVDSIKYDLTTNIIKYRADKRLNEVEYSALYGFDSFKWGDDNTLRNKVYSDSYISNRNGYGILDSNIVSNLSGLSNESTYTANLPQIKNNIVNSNSFINIDMNVSSGLVYYNTVQSSSEIRIYSFDANSSVSDNNLASASIMTIGNLVNTSFNQNSLSSNASVTLPLISVSTNGYFRINTISQKTINFSAVNSTIENYILSYSYSTFPITLDMNDASIFNAGVLTISNARKPFGIVTLLNCTGKTILKIVGVDTFDKIFIPTDGETVTFQHTLIGASSNNDLVCDAPASANLLTGRTNGSDYIQYRVLGARNLRSNLVLLA